MPQTLLQIAQEHAGGQGLAIPAQIAGSADPYAIQILTLLNDFNRDMMTRKCWQKNLIEVTFTSVNAEVQSAISTLCPQGYVGVYQDTMWDRSQLIRWAGGVDPEAWQMWKASNLTGPIPRFRIRNDLLLTYPLPAAGHTIAFEYMSSWFVQAAADGAVPATAKSRWTKDTDTCRLDDNLPVAYLAWAWKSKKGFEYAEDFSAYERLVKTFLAADRAPEAVCLDNSYRAASPGIVIPAGSWMQP